MSLPLGSVIKKRILLPDSETLCAHSRLTRWHGVKRSSELRGRDRDDARSSIPRVSVTLLDAAKRWIGMIRFPFCLVAGFGIWWRFCTYKKELCSKISNKCFVEWVGWFMSEPCSARKENPAFMYFAVLELCCSFFRFFWATRGGLGFWCCLLLITGSGSCVTWHVYVDGGGGRSNA